MFQIAVRPKWRALPRAPQVSGEAPLAPFLSMISLPTDSTPEFDVYGSWREGDELQFESQVAGGDWTSVNRANHTLDSSEVSDGSPVQLSMTPLDPGPYEFRVRYRRDGGEYSGYSNVESTVITDKPSATFIAEAGLSGDGGGTVKSVNSSIGNPFSTRRVMVFGGLQDEHGGYDIVSVTIGGVEAGFVQEGSGFEFRWMASAIVPNGNTADIVVTYSSGSFISGPIFIYIVDDQVLNDSSPVARGHNTSTSSTSNLLSVETQDGGFVIAYCTVFGGTDANPYISDSDDDMTVAFVTTNAFIAAQANGTLSRTSNVTFEWVSPARDSYGTIWSFR